MDLTKRAQQQANRKRRHGNGRTFFTWFNDVSDPSADDIAEVCRTWRSRFKVRVKVHINNKIDFLFHILSMQWLNSKGFIWFLFSNFSLTSFIFILLVDTGKQGTIYGTLVATYFNFCLHLITAQHS